MKYVDRTMVHKKPTFLENVLFQINHAFRTMDFNSKLIEEYYYEVSSRHIKINLRNSMKLIIIFWYGAITFNTLISPHGTTSIIYGLLSLIALLLCYCLTMFTNPGPHMKLLTLTMLLMFVIINNFNLYYSISLPEINFTPTIQISLLMFTNLTMKLHVAVVVWVVSYGLLLMTIITNVEYKIVLNNTSYFSNSASVVNILWMMPLFAKKFKLERYIFGLMILGFGVTSLCMYLFFINNIRRRSAFLRLGQNIQIKHQFKAAMKTQLRWIDAIMPEVIKNQYVEHNEEIKMGKWVYVQNFENVTILFADIVGFTNICSTKIAADVVTLLNDLFNRFDELCSLTNCEKLGTLGDCYYCVAGCPLPRPDHAVSCIEMGLGMCRIIKTFNIDHRENVNMRVGVHTGRVNAAVIGKNRFRFDVYSNDVIIANTMESSGKPGFVHISQPVYGHVRFMYKVENGEDLEIKQETEQGIAGKLLKSSFIKTYFIDPKSPHMQYGEETFGKKNVLKVFNLIPTRSTSSMDSEMEYKEVVEVEINIRHKINQDTTFIEGLRLDPDCLIKLFVHPPLNIFSMMFIDQEIEWNFNNYVMNELNTMSFDSVKVVILLDSVTCIVYSCFVYAALIVIIPDLSWKVLLVVVGNIVLAILISIVNSWQCFNLKSILNKSSNYLCYSCLSHPFVRSFMCFYFLSIPLLIIVLTLHDCTKLYVDYSFTTRYFALIIFSLFIIPLFLSAHHLIKILVCILDTAFALYVVTLKPCVRQSLAYTFPHHSCLGQMNMTDIAFYEKVKYSYVFQIVMTSLLMILVIRELEMNIRLLFYVTREAEIRKEETSEAMNNAEDLLYNIIPKYVFNQLKSKSGDLLVDNLSYAMSISKAAVVFACISNFFSKYYREDYKGGENALKLLHKIICCFDDLIKKKIYKDVEKIKTINDCYMVASGLNVKMLEGNGYNAHLIALMLYAFDMIKVLEHFNENYIIGTDKFEMKIGYNFGPVTAGIIGSTKPMYDIWGDTVNVSSRMYSTGSVGKIQVPELVSFELQKEFVFEYRGVIFVKGKGNMNTFTCVRPAISEDNHEKLMNLPQPRDLSKSTKTFHIQTQNLPTRSSKETKDKKKK